MQATYVTTAVAAELMDIPGRTLRHMIQTEKIRSSQVAGPGKGGGLKNVIHISDLPREAQLKWALMQDRTGNGDFDMAGYKAKYGQEGVDGLINRLDAVREMIAYRDSGAGGICDKRKEVAARLNISPTRLSQLQKAYEEGGLAAMAEGTARRDKGTPRALCAMAQDIVASETCLSTRPTNRSIYDRLCKIANQLQEDACAVCPHNEGSLHRARLINAGMAMNSACDSPKEGMIVPRHYGTVDRYIASIPASVRDMGRMGTKYWEAQYMPKALRAKPENVNEVWYGDHHVFDVFVLDNQGKAVRPWLTAWMDARSGCMVGWALSMNPNSDTIMESLTRAIGRTKGSPFFGAPLMTYIDNGKDYRCKRLEGDGLRDYSIGRLNVDFGAENALLKTLGIGVTHAIPYRAWSKTIERAFGTIERRWIQGVLPGWCGHESKARPEQLNEDIRNKKLLTYEQFCTYFIDTVMPEYHALKDSDGKSPMDIYLSSEKARGDEVVSWAVLSMTKQNRAQRRVGTTGIRFNGRTYMDPALHDHIGEVVTILYSGRDTDTISVMQGAAFICEAAEVDKMRLVGEDEERLAAHMKAQQSAKQRARAALQLPRERAAVLRDLVMETPDLDAATTITSLVHEQAYQARKEARRRVDKAQGKRTAAEKRAETTIRDSLAARGRELLQAAEG